MLAPTLYAAGVAMAPFLVAAGPFIAAAVGIAAAGYQIYKNWGDLKLIFSEAWGEMVSGAQAAWGKVKPIFDGMARIGSFVMNPFGGGSLAPGQPVLGGGAAPAARAATEARVSVSFENMPRGARVTPDRANTAPLDLSMGYSMGAP
jgi:hypothetical protein